MNIVAWMIVACEIAFWVVIILGLSVRYLLQKERLGFLLLALTPIIDFILLIVTALDLYHGATATTAHAIAAVYIGVSIAFGKSMIAWADDRFRYYMMKQGAKPIKRYGYDYARYYLISWLKHVLAYAIGIGCLFVIITLIQDSERTATLTSTMQWWTRILGIDFLIMIAYFIWPKKIPSEHNHAE